MNDRPGGGERVVLVHVKFPVGEMQENLEEFKDLSVSAGADIAGVVTGVQRTPAPKYFVGSGKAAEIQETVASNKAQLVIFNHILTPAQERNLERLLQCRVLDRTGLILDIFAQRARSFEGKLQVELAFLKHQSTRLVRGWTHLERQRGGIGMRSGPGETQLEVDRRLIRSKIKQITARLDKIRRQREQSRRARRKAVVPTVALVGYTNAGKSTLFNWLTHANVYVADQLFATLDPTLRRVDLPSYGPVIFADTVGFISHLPYDLIEAFQATLQEVTEADLLLHVVDMHEANRETRIAEVNHVLTTIHADRVPRLLVCNKIDLCDLPAGDKAGKLFVSAQTGAGLPELVKAVGDALFDEKELRRVILKPAAAKLRAELYARDAVMSETLDEEGNFHLVIRLNQRDFDRLFSFL